MIPGIRDLQNIFPAEYGAGYYLISNLIASVTAAFMLIPALAGMCWGERLREKLSPSFFKKVLMLSLLLLGVYLGFKS